MALQSPFFGKRENEPVPGARPSGNKLGTTSSLGSASHPPTQPLGNLSSTTPASGNLSANPRMQEQEDQARLTVGPNIKLKGVEVTDCDAVSIEGTMDGSMKSQRLEIAEKGQFNGTAEVEVAEIHGKFDGDLIARNKLTICATGWVTGTVRYGKIIIEEGGQISGDVQSANSANLSGGSNKTNDGKKETRKSSGSLV